MNRRKWLKTTGLTTIALGARPPTAAMGFSEKESSVAPSRLVIRGGTVFDAISGTMLPKRTIVVEGKLIRMVGIADQDTPISGRSRVIEAGGKYVVPGLIDAHVHLVYLLDSAHITGDEILPFFLANGVTSVRDVGDHIVAQKLVAAYAEAHPELSPRVFLGSPFINGNFHGGNANWILDPEQVPEFVENMAGWGVNTLKIYYGAERPVGRKVIEEGHRHGMMITAHLGRYRVQDAVADGIDCLEHILPVFSCMYMPTEAPVVPGPEERLEPGVLQDLRLRMLEWKANLNLNNPTAQELIATLAQRKVLIDPTLVVYRNWELLSDQPEFYQHPDNYTMPKRLTKFWWDTRGQAKLDPETHVLRRRMLGKYQELTGVLYRAGVPLLAGTDACVQFCPPGFAIHQELELLVESGLTPAAALQAATVNNARALQQDEHIGSVTEGKLADLVILDADPLANIRNSRKIHKVIRGGLVCDPKALLQKVPVV